MGKNKEALGPTPYQKQNIGGRWNSIRKNAGAGMRHHLLLETYIGGMRGPAEAERGVARRRSSGSRVARCVRDLEESLTRCRNTPLADAHPALILNGMSR